jgi:cytochrome c-type biogenesis protein CcmE
MLSKVCIAGSSQHWVGRPPARAVRRGGRSARLRGDAQVGFRRIPAGREHRLGGLVAPGSIETGEGGLGLKFKMTDGTETVTVATTAVPPAMFREGIGVVVEGALQADGTFATDRLMIKHDNEYQAPGKGDSRSVKQLAETLEPTAAGDPR